ncbi:hypothetical protein AVEN_217450-1 [Araneus ventricosus]|uniref:Uncharacterized protein n=1 Tax=Araneus ventricosus TaxID=182803 RepID=A0A4Y2NLI6_ARAVE|nr:hypothetical protein AVEN_217450-1 [Araneus ventricosus]
MEEAEQVKNFCGVSFYTTEQHVDAKLSKVTRDNNDCKKFGDWFICHNHSHLGRIVIFAVNASPFLLPATVKYHIEKNLEGYPRAVQYLDSFMYVDERITSQDTGEEALLVSRLAKNIMKEAEMVMAKWINNDS